jgi:hypothetical protein
MDKWDEITHRIQQAALAEEPEAACPRLQLFAEFGRTLETISARHGPDRDHARKSASRNLGRARRFTTCDQSGPAEDAFNLLCHHKLGSGFIGTSSNAELTRKLVVKVESRFAVAVFCQCSWK